MIHGSDKVAKVAPGFRLLFGIGALLILRPYSWREGEEGQKREQRCKRFHDELVIRL